MTLGPDRKTRQRWALLHDVSVPLRARVTGKKADDPPDDDDDDDDDEDDDDEEDDDDSDDDDDSEEDDDDDEDDDDPDDDDDDDDQDDDDSDRKSRGSRPKVKTKVIDGVRYVSQTDFDWAMGKVRTQARDAERRRREQEDEDAKDLAEKNFRKLLRKKDREIERLRGDRDADRVSRLRAKVAKDLNVPESLVDRLRGDDEAALRKDAKRLLKGVTARPAPDTQTGATRKEQAGKNPPASNRRYRFQQPGDRITTNDGK